MEVAPFSVIVPEITSLLKGRGPEIKREGNGGGPFFRKSAGDYRNKFLTRWCVMVKKMIDSIDGNKYPTLYPANMFTNSSTLETTLFVREMQRPEMFTVGMVWWSQHLE
ncbi:hypothetical protein AMTR_s00005p00226300 [Amborella trichopoda]|uniref:Uncharacterized protein n=1 Tax=Amborella trichopoda TaxID=13333 RepID=W1PI92_AMBTC|nr:hypothetical protein AMTR_s00005p00226300 [Amborella trichopoda]